MWTRWSRAGGLAGALLATSTQCSEATPVAPADAGPDAPAVAESTRGLFRCDGYAWQALQPNGTYGTTGDCSFANGTCNFGAPVLHWNGVSWDRGTACLPVKPAGISAGAPNEVWMAGLAHGESQPGLVYRWDGHWWTEMLRDATFVPFGIWRDPSGVVWAYGQDTKEAARVLRWDGAWSDVSPVLEHGAHTSIRGMHGAPRGIVWAVGGHDDLMTPLLLRWSDARWRELATNVQPGHVLHAVWASTDQDAWAVGDAIVHWNGSTWTQWVFSPYDDTAHVRLLDVIGFGPDDLWATNGVHWDGTAWRRELGGGAVTSYANLTLRPESNADLPTAMLPPPRSTLFGVAPSWGQSCWGYTPPSTGVWIWDGREWSWYDGPMTKALAELHWPFGMMLSPTGRDVWLALARGEGGGGCDQSSVKPRP